MANATPPHPARRAGSSVRMRAVQPPAVPIITELIRRTPGTISLGQGVVSYGPPPQALERVRAALDAPATHTYQPGEGLPALIEALEEKLLRENRVLVRPGSRVMVTAGANMAFVHVILATLDPGDEVILPLPWYFNHEMAVVMASGRPVGVATDDHYQLRPDALESAITPRTKAIVTISPNNPSGAVFTEEALREVNAICRRHGIYHITDEVYEYFTYGGVRHFSPGSIPGSSDYTISLYSFSKAYGLAGWRVGYMVVPERLYTEMAKIQDTVMVCPPVASQIAALGALEAGPAYCSERLEELTRVREAVLGELDRIRPICSAPSADGAFYCLVRVSTHTDPMILTERLIREHRVAVLPGTTFGLTAGCYLRLAYGALDRERVAEGIGRLVGGLAALAG